MQSSIPFCIARRFSPFSVRMRRGDARVERARFRADTDLDPGPTTSRASLPNRVAACRVARADLAKQAWSKETVLVMG
jgi:hypothetical protein